MEDVRVPTEAKDYFSSSIWWPETLQAVGGLRTVASGRDGINGIYFAAGRDAFEYNSKEIITPETSEVFEEKKSLTDTRNGVNDIFEGVGEGNGDYGHYSRQMLSSEIVEIVEDGKSITSNNDRRVVDLYVAVGEDDLDVVKWSLVHAVSPGARIFLIHVSPPITLIPTPVGKLQRSQLTPQRVRIYVNEVNNKRKDLLQKYVDMSTDYKVTAETLLLESNDIGKAILDLISILNITNLVIGMKKPPCSRHSTKLSKGEFVKKNAPKFCEVTLVYNGEEFVSTPYMDGLRSQCILSRNKGHLKRNLFQCLCSSGCIEEIKGK